MLAGAIWIHDQCKVAPLRIRTPDDDRREASIIHAATSPATTRTVGRHRGVHRHERIPAVEAAALIGPPKTTVVTAEGAVPR